MPKGVVKPNKKRDADKAEVMTKMLQYWRNNAKKALVELVSTHYIPKSELSKLLDRLDPRKVDRGNEAYTESAESFRMGFNLALSQLRQALNIEGDDSSDSN